MKTQSKLLNYIYCILLSSALVCGRALDSKGYIAWNNPWGYVVILLISIILMPIITIVIAQLSKHIQASPGRLSADIRVFSIKGFVIRFFILVACYIPVWLAAWPGFFCYDAETETYMVLTFKYSAHHPLVHELLLGETLRLGNRIFGNFNAGIALYIGIQMLIVSGIFAYMLTALERIGIPTWLINIDLAFLALFPTVSMFVLCSTKDVYFTAGLVLLCTIILEMSVGICEKHTVPLFVLGSVLLLFFRKNGIYAYPFMLLAFYIFYVRKASGEERKCHSKVLIAGIISVISYFVISSLLLNALHAKKDEVGEMLCIPMQQLARVYNEAPEVWDEDDQNVLFSLIPEVILQDYNPKLADNVKVNFLEDNFKAEPQKYISLWWKTLLRCPGIYANAIMANTYGYWYPDTILDGYRGYWIVDRYYGDSCYFAFVTEAPGTRASFIPWLEKFYEMISLEVSFQKIPVVSWLFSIGFWMWVGLFVVLFVIQSQAQNSTRLLVCFIIPIILWLINLLGPIALVRYVLFLFFGLPLILAIPLCCYRSNKKKDRSQSLGLTSVRL